MRKIFYAIFVLFIISKLIYADDFKQEIKIIKEKLKEGDVYKRIKAAEGIRDIQLPLETKVEILLEALKEEIENPTQESSHPFHNIYGGTEAMKLVYVKEIANIGKDALPVLYKWYKKSSGDLKDNITFAIIGCGDLSFTDKYWEIANNSKNNYTRAKALTYINSRKLYKKEYIPKYIEFLKDPFCVWSGSDVISSGEYEYMNIKCPIRDASFSALVKLGVKVKRVKNEYYVVEEEKK